MLDHLVGTLRHPFIDGFFNTEQLFHNSPETRIFKLTYRLMKPSIRDNNYNQVYTGLWLDLFLTQAKVATEENELGTYDLLEVLLGNVGVQE